MKYLKSILVWLCFIPSAILNGGFREYILERYIDTALANTISGVILCIIILIITWLLLPRLVVLNRKESYITGLIWMLLTVIFEFISGIVTGIPMEELISAYNPLSGNLWILVILTTMFSPVIISREKTSYKNKTKNRIVELYRGELWECQLMESILKDNGIDCFLKNNIRSGYGPIVSPAEQVLIMINESDMKKGLTVLESINLNSREERYDKQQF